jgi:hypothetical protein
MLVGASLSFVFLFFVALSEERDPEAAKAAFADLGKR